MKYLGFGVNYAVRITASGALDTAFSEDGILEVPRRDGNSGGILPLAAGGYLVGSVTTAIGAPNVFYYLRKLDDAGNTVGTDETTRSLVDGLPAAAGQTAKAIIDREAGNDAMCSVSDTGTTSSCVDLPADVTVYQLVRLELGRGNRTVAAFTTFVTQFADVALDSNFGASGRRELQVPNATSPTIRGLAVVDVTNNEEIYVLGDAVFGTSRRLFVAKLDEAGNYVTGFGSNGSSIIDFPNLDKEVGIQLWPEGDHLYVLFLSADAGESASLRGKLHAARLWR
jgi:hypothetical protein